MEAQTCSDGYTASPHPDEPRSDGRYTCYPPHCRCDASKCSSGFDDCWTTAGTPDDEEQTCRDGYLPIATNDWGLKCSSGGDDCWADPNMEAQTCSDGYTASPHPDDPRNEGRYTCYPPHCRCDASKCSSYGNDCYADGTPDGEAQTCRDGYLPIAIRDWHKCSSGGDDCWADPNMEAQTCSDGYTASPHPDEPRNEGRYTCYPPHCRCDASKCSSRDGDDCYADLRYEAQTCRDGYLPAPAPPPSPPPTPCVHDDSKCSSSGNDCYTYSESEAQTCSDGYTASPHPDDPRSDGRYTCYPPHCRCDASKCSSRDGDDCLAFPGHEAQTCRDGYLPIAINDWHKCSSDGDDCWADPNMEAQTCSDGYTASPHPDEPRSDGRYTCYPPHCRCDASKCSSGFDDCWTTAGTPDDEEQTCRDGYLPIATNDWGLKCSSGGDDCWADPNMEAQTCSDGYTASPHPDDPRNEGRYTCYPPHCRCDASKCSSAGGGDCYADGRPDGEAQTCRDGYLPIAIRDSHKCVEPTCWADPNMEAQTCSDGYTASPHPDDPRNEGRYTCYPPHCRCDASKCSSRDGDDCHADGTPYGEAQTCRDGYLPIAIRDSHKCSSGGGCWADPNYEAQTCSDGYTTSPHPDDPRNEGRYTCYPPHCRCDASKCSSRDGDDCYASPPGEAQTCRDGYLPIAIRDSHSGGDCCGDDGGYCGSEWVSTDASTWIDTCTGLDFIRVSPGCGVEVATETGGGGETFTYDSSVLVCGYECEPRPTPGCDRVRSLRLFPLAPPPPPHPPFQPGQAPAPPPPSPCVHDDSKCVEPTCWADPNMEAQTCSDGYTASPHPDEPRNEGRYTCYPPHCRCDASKCSSRDGDDCYASPPGEAQTCRDGYLPIATNAGHHKCLSGGNDCWADPNMEAQTCSDGYTASPHPDEPRNEGRYTCYPPHCLCDASKCSSRDGDDCYASPPGEAQTCRDGYLPIAIRDSLKCSSGGDDCWADPNMEAQTCSDGYTASPHPDDPRNEGRYTCYPPHCRCDASKCSSRDGDDCYASPPGEAQTCRDGYLPIAIRGSHKCVEPTCWADPNMEAQTCSDGYTASPHPDDPRNEGRYTCYPPHCRCDASKCSSYGNDCYADGTPDGEAQTCRDGYLPIAIRGSHKCLSGGDDCWADPNMEAQTCSDGYTASPHPDEPRNEGRYTCYPPHCRCDASKCSSYGNDCYADGTPDGEAQTCRDGYLPIAIRDWHKCSSGGDDCWADPNMEAQTCSDGYTASPHPDEPRNEGRYTCYPPHCRCDASKCSSRDGDDCYADLRYEAQTCRDGYLPCAARGYEYVGCNCDPASECSPWGSSSGGDCCGDDGGYCGSEWVSTDASTWIDTCTGLDFIRVSPGCGVEVATEAGGGGETFTYDSSVLVCGYECEPRPTPGCDRVRSLRLFPLAPPPPPHPPFQPGQAPAPPPPSPCVHDDSKCSSSGNDCYVNPDYEAQTCSDGYTASPHPDDPRNEGRYTCYPPHCRCDASKCSSRDGDDCYADGTPDGEAQTCRDGYLVVPVNDGQYTCCFDFDQPPSSPSALECDTLDFQIFTNTDCSGSPAVTSAMSDRTCVATPDSVLTGQYFDVDFTHWGMHATSETLVHACSDSSMDSCVDQFDGGERCSDVPFETCVAIDEARSTGIKITCAPAVDCAVPSEGVCLEYGSVDSDCCGNSDVVGCASGYILSLQIAIDEGGTWARPADAGFYPQCASGGQKIGNTCCTPDPSPPPPSPAECCADVCPTRSYCEAEGIGGGYCNCGDCGVPSCGDCDCNHYGEQCCDFSGGCDPTCGGEPSMCRDNSNDCCANEAMGEAAVCEAGYVPTVQPQSYDDCPNYTCMPAPPPSPTCVDDPKGILAADAYLSPGGTTCAEKMAQVGATCETIDEDYNGYRVSYAQLCPATCGTCASYTEPECHRPEVCCCDPPPPSPPLPFGLSAVSPDALTFSEAVAWCAAQGLTLAMPRTESENEAVYAACQSYYACWLDARENAAGDGWVDGDGNALTYTNWDGGEGSCHCGENRIFINRVGTAEWHDVGEGGDGQTHAICQQPSGSISPSPPSSTVCDTSQCAEYSPTSQDDDCCALDSDIYCMNGYTLSRVMPGTPGVTWLNGQMSGCEGYGGNTCCSPPESLAPPPSPSSCARGYTAVSGEGCSNYIHMDDASTYGVQGGSTTLEECAAAVQALNGQDGCVGEYFFFETDGYCNCPTDACTTGSENSNAGGSGQLYRFNSDCDSSPSSLQYVGSPQQGYAGAMAYCATLGGTLASATAELQAMYSTWTSAEIWILDSGSGGSSLYDTCHAGGCPCINCAYASEAWGYGAENELSCYGGISGMASNLEHACWAELDTRPSCCGYCGPWAGSADGTQWVETCHHLDIIRVTPGCSYELERSDGQRFTFHQDTRVCANTVGCDSVRRIRLHHNRWNGALIRWLRDPVRICGHEPRMYHVRFGDGACVGRGRRQRCIHWAPAAVLSARLQWLGLADGCVARGYESVGCNCDPASECSPWGSSSGGDCCGDDGGYCGSEWVSTDASTWIDTCTELDFIRVSPGCGVEVATETGGGGETFTYDSSVLVCGYECEPRPTPGCDRVRSLRLFPLAPPPPPHPPFQPGQAPAPPPPSPCVHDDSKCSSSGNDCYVNPDYEAQTCSDGYTASPHPDEPRSEWRYTCYPPHCRCDASKCSSRDGDDCHADGRPDVGNAGRLDGGDPTGLELCDLCTEWATDLCGETALAKECQWAGCSDFMRDSDREEEGTFAWVDGSPVDYTNWGSGEPNSYGSTNEDCAGFHVYYTDGKWNDFTCGGIDSNDGNAPIGYRVLLDASQMTGDPASTLYDYADSISLDAQFHLVDTISGTDLNQTKIIDLCESAAASATCAIGDGATISELKLLQLLDRTDTIRGDPLLDASEIEGDGAGRPDA
ncbi:hypothetical protein EMIHUDRAFT_223963 [Emiliania huxleyi CCMP1516]|uniref:C-type lectin domain-containing protein n=2 Tax=Emiliania huxleyi TaxID=2903 RepID=A0A0D3KTJ3_EMIH1|nr:hypothetical protein EMIHUDRAFT_223963 [Emiliania huxleyi CCMP1516]EOD39078.1 hypothetical protein EMIHUDRAFT_223963 [Emiliania huxleyi CCMP1516]|eukprot:XP_005791507.1 hypothetical protein EMIHUDRAFT_223963 [Emiliania huxleyi CCMP1516]